MTTNLIEKIQKMWKEDSRINPDDLHNESLKVPELHSKYYEMFTNIMLLKKSAEEEKNITKHKRYEFYTGKANPEEYEDVCQKKIRDKSHLDLCLNADEAITKLNLKIEYYNTVLDYLSDIIKMIHSRTYQIKNSIDAQKIIMGF
jgi:hypothetical protein